MPSDAALDDIFSRLVAVVRAQAGFLDTESDTDSAYTLTGPPLPGRRENFWFGGVRRGKRYVSLHLMAVYMYPDLRPGPEAVLAARMHGKSCFNFVRLDDALLVDAEALVGRCVGRLVEDGVISRRA